MRLDIVHPQFNTVSGAFDDLRDYLHHSVLSCGVESTVYRDSWPADGIPLFLGYSQLPAAVELKPCIIYQTEVINDTADGHVSGKAAALAMLRKATAVWDFDADNVAALAAEGIRAQHVPVGYHPAMQRYEQAAVKDIDFFFYGCINKRRARIFEKLAGYGKRVEVRGVQNGLYGKERDALIAHTKVLPYPYFYDTGHVFGAVRPGYLLNNGSLVVVEDSESLRRVWPDHPVQAEPYDELVGALMDTVDRSAVERSNMADEGAHWWQARPMAPHVERAIRSTPCLS